MSSFCQCTNCVYNIRNECDDVTTNNFNSDAECYELSLIEIVRSGDYIVESLNDFLDL